MQTASDLQVMLSGRIMAPSGSYEEAAEAGAAGKHVQGTHMLAKPF